MRAARAALFAAAFLVSGCAGAVPKGAGEARPVAYVDRDTVWRGDVAVPGIVHVRKNATLTILPGARVLFGTGAFPTPDEHEGFTGAGIKVEGRIVALGTEEAPIVFTSQAAAKSPSSWDKILFAFSTGNRFRHCLFEGARYAFHAHFSEISVEKCVFRDNEEGVRLGTSTVRIEGSVFTRNAIRGINFRECRNEIRGNLVYENGDGIFLHSRDGLSVIRENAIYNNRGYNLRLGDLHDEGIDVSGNWWGTRSEAAALATVYDGRSLPGIGKAVLAPLLAAPPVTGAEVRGVFMAGLSPVAAGEVRAYASVEDGFWTEGMAAAAKTDAEGRFRLPVPPGRYYVVGRASRPGGALFGFPGRNPIAVGLGERAEVGIPAVDVPAAGAPRTTPSARPSVRVTVSASGRPVDGVTVQLFRAQAPDLRGAGEASAVTNADGAATLYAPPGRYHVAAKKRVGGASVGMVEEGGLFGIYPESPVLLAEGACLSIEIPLFEKRGLLSDDDARTNETPAGPSEGNALLDGRPAAGRIVYFYRPAETVGRPLARSSVVSASGRFAVSLPGAGEYVAFLRKAAAGNPGSVDEERLGPVPVRALGGRLVPSDLAFRATGRLLPEGP